MKSKIIQIIPILILLMSCNQKQKQIDTWNNRIAEYQAETDSKTKTKNLESENQKIVADTITNWQFYKDSELLFASNMVDSNRFTAEIKKSDKYENLYLKFFYDFNNEIMKREIKLVYENKTLATFVNENRSHSPFPIEKYILDRIRMINPNKEMKIVYSDPIMKNGIIVGLLKLTNE
ncbi:hypothetical protein GZ212_15930 [Mangrovimonas sp. CR14]|uniref:hypothetical protein n=1 Tax=Mangrovimonas sp. CR14 TaxID=2706120 RepID=UPI0014229DD2|nr:hypothetical protein [Mangrovimonas sp. CR14]NIK93650.1 hypothetical protein [Mangrovimonas sp. CR14]